MFWIYCSPSLTCKTLRCGVFSAQENGEEVVWSVTTTTPHLTTNARDGEGGERRKVGLGSTDWQAGSHQILNFFCAWKKGARTGFWFGLGPPRFSFLVLKSESWKEMQCERVCMYVGTRYSTLVHVFVTYVCLSCWKKNNFIWDVTQAKGNSQLCRRIYYLENKTLSTPMVQ